MKTKVLALTLLAVSLAGCRKSSETKVLNNFVTQLLEVTTVSGPYTEYTFSNPRDGWIFISSTVNAADSGQVMLAVDSKSVEDVVLVHQAGKERTLEAMRFLSAGEHKVSVWCEGSLLPEKLVVRAIPELIFCNYGGNPSVSEYGPYDWKFLEKNILTNVNTIAVGAGDQLPAPHIEQWKKQGKRWIGGCGITWESSTSSEDYDYWTGFLNKNPYLDGVLVDEFCPRARNKGAKKFYYPKQYVQWTEALEKIYAEEQFRGKVFYAYIGDWTNYMWETQRCRSFAQTLMDCGYRSSWERYFREQPTEAEAKEHLEWHLRRPMLGWRNAQPGVEKHMIICLGLFSLPPISLNNNPAANYKVFMDMQVNMIANDPAFSGIAGLEWWTASYADEETVRWTGRLLRHYCIEGKTEMLSKDPYELPHIENPDFNKGTNGWAITTAEEGSIEVRSYVDYGELQGRHYTDEGGNFLWMRRSGKGPNIFSQEIRNLQPGRLYSLKMFVTDYNDLIEGKKPKEKPRYVGKIRIDGAEVNVDKSFRHSFTTSRSEEHPKEIWMSFHWLIFRAKGNTATLAISDWAGEEEPGGPIGQELIYNFIEIQPYLED